MKVNPVISLKSAPRELAGNGLTSSADGIEAGELALFQLLHPRHQLCHRKVHHQSVWTHHLYALLKLTLLVCSSRTGWQWRERKRIRERDRERERERFRLTSADGIEAGELAVFQLLHPRHQLVQPDLPPDYKVQNESDKLNN